VDSNTRRFVRTCVFIYNPRLLKKFKDIAEKFPLEYSVPDTLSNIVDYDVIILDEEAYRLIDNDILCLSKNRKIYRVDDEEDLIRVILRIITGSETGMHYLAVGVDLGSKIAYAVLADNMLIGAGTVLSPEEFLAMLIKLKRALKPLRAVIKVGLPGSDTLYQLLLKLLKQATQSGYEVYVIDESRTTSKPLPHFKGLRNIRTTKDINAAINIALRSGGVRIHYAGDHA